LAVNGLLMVRQVVDDVVTVDVGDLRVAGRVPPIRAASPPGFQATGVRDDPDAAVQAGAEDVLKLGEERLGRTRRKGPSGGPSKRISMVSLGEVVAGEDVDRAAPRPSPAPRPAGRRRKAGAVRDPDRALHAAGPGRGATREGLGDADPIPARRARARPVRCRRACRPLGDRQAEVERGCLRRGPRRPPSPHVHLSPEGRAQDDPDRGTTGAGRFVQPRS